MVRLGSNTKVYRSYGKRQQHTVNKAATAKEWRAGSVASSDSSILSYKSALEDVSFVSNQPVRSSHPPKSSKVHKDSERTAIVLSSDDENDDEDSRIIDLSSDSSVAFERSLVLSDESQDEDDVQLDSAEVQVDQTYREKTPAWLVQLLASCTLDHVIDFQDFVTKPPRAVARTGLMDWVKVGEASYSEVFRVGDTVVKIMPLADPSTRGDEVQAKSNWPMLSNVESVEREIKISASVDKIDGFVGFKGAYVVRGSFPENLLVQWDLFHEERVRQKHAEAGLQCKPDVLPAEQYYVLICLEDGGVDLEAFRLRNWREARNVFQQTANALARAEERFDFEHRDLHWGNILIKEPENLNAAFNKLSLATKNRQTKQEREISVSVIDFTLTRMRASNGHIIFDDFACEELFEGEGDLQFDTYRLMRQVVKEDWEAFHPATNVMWLRYVAKKILHDKGLSIPVRTTPKSEMPRKRKPSRTARQVSPAIRAEDRQAYEDVRAWALQLDKIVDEIVKCATSSTKAARQRKATHVASTRDALVELGLLR